MAPEIHMHIPYQGQVVDLFALGVIFFILTTGTFPFREARVEDPYYKHIAARDYKKFWQMHEAIHKGSAKVKFTDNFKDLISGMLAFQPFQRPSLADVVFHPWFTEGQVATSEEIKNNMSLRYAKLNKRESSPQREDIQFWTRNKYPSPI